MYEIAAARSIGQGGARFVARAGRMLVNAGERIDGLSSTDILRRFVALDEDGRYHLEAIPQAAKLPATRASGLATLQQRLNAIDCSPASGAIQSPADLVGKANQILDGARSEGRTSLTPSESTRFNRLAMVAEASAATSRPYRRRLSPQRVSAYRAEVIGR